MKQKSGGIKRLMEFTGKHRGLLTVSRILSGISPRTVSGSPKRSNARRRTRTEYQ